MNNMIAEHIIHLRKKKNMTQEDVAKAIGVTNQAVSKWEAGINYPDLELLPQLSSLFEVSIDYLFTGLELSSAASENIPLELKDDGKIRILIFKGKRLLSKDFPNEDEYVHINFDGNPAEVYGHIIIDGDVDGDVSAKGNLTVNGDVSGDASANGNLNVGGDIGGDASTNGDLTVGGDVYGNIIGTD